LGRSGDVGPGPIFWAGKTRAGRPKLRPRPGGLLSCPTGPGPSHPPTFGGWGAIGSRQINRRGGPIDVPHGDRPGGAHHVCAFPVRRGGAFAEKKRAIGKLRVRSGDQRWGGSKSERVPGAKKTHSRGFSSRWPRGKALSRFHTGPHVRDFGSRVVLPRLFWHWGGCFQGGGNRSGGGGRSPWGRSSPATWEKGWRGGLALWMLPFPPPGRPSGAGEGWGSQGRPRFSGAVGPERGRD